MSNKLQYICKKTNTMKPSEARKTIEKQIADLEMEKYQKIREIWEIEAKIERKKSTLKQLTNYLTIHKNHEQDERND